MLNTAQNLRAIAGVRIVFNIVYVNMKMKAIVLYSAVWHIVEL